MVISFGFFLHELLGICQNQFCKVFCRGSCNYLTGKSFFNKFWQTSGMVKMSMADDYRIAGGRVKCKWRKVSFFRITSSLKKAAFDNYFFARSLKHNVRASYLTAGSIETKPHNLSIIGINSNSYREDLDNLKNLVNFSLVKA